MTIQLRDVKSTSTTVTKRSGFFTTAPAPIHMDRYGGTGDFVPVSFNLKVEEKTGEKTRYILEVVVLNKGGNPMSTTFAHPAISPRNFEGETVAYKLSACPDDILEAVSTIPGVNLVDVVEQLRTVEDILRFV